MTAPTELNVDALAQEIRRIDGSNSLGAGALAEALLPFLSALPASEAGWRKDRLPTRDEFKAAMAVIFACNGFDLSQWTDDIWPDEGLGTVAKYMRRCAPAAPDRRAGE